MNMGRATKSYVSAYNRARVHVSNLYGYESRALTANFNGAMPKDRTIASAQWQTWNNYTIVMSDPDIDGREVSVRVKAQVPGPGVIKCTITLDNGDIMVQQFRINVLCAPMYSPMNWQSGPQMLEAFA